MPSRRTFVKRTLTGTAGLALSGFLGSATAQAREGAGTRNAAETRRRYLKAAKQGDLEAVRKALDAHPELVKALDAQGRSGFTLAHLGGHDPVGDFLLERGYLPDFHEAALAGDWERVGTLTDAARSPSPDQDHPIGGSAMFAAALGGAGTDIWRVYAANGHPDVATRGVSALQAALLFPDLEVAELTAATLLANAAAPDAPGKREAPPLHLAASRGSQAIVEILIRRGANLDALDARGRSAVAVAQSAGHAGVVELLRRHRQIPRDHNTSREAYDSRGKAYSPRELSGISPRQRRRVVGSAHGNLDAVREAVSRDARLAHSVATTGERAVEAGAHMGRKDIVDYLLEQGAPYSLPTAVMRGDTGRVRALLDEDPRRIHERGAHDFALLWYPVIGGGNLEIMQLLLERGAQVERQHWLGTTALHWAAMGGLTSMVELLLDHGADVDRPGRKFGGVAQTPLQLAQQRERTDVIDILRRRGAGR
ncbi:hypothetical protein ABI59_22055 [Acidobacteria bacterium Mor1]|nr:hypothetical protein ABI59_22055 [Acidobacteria bacterium Mor1]